MRVLDNKNIILKIIKKYYLLKKWKLNLYQNYLKLKI